MKRVIATAALGVLIAAPAWAESVTFHAMLNAASEVPPKDTKGSGEAMATLDTASKDLTYTVTFTGLTGPATMAHLHGPAAAGANAGVQVPLGNNPSSPINGSAKLTDAQVANLMAGNWYVNVHTAVNPGGEIRGQLAK
jgi:hypothetical protein